MQRANYIHTIILYICIFAYWELGSRNVNVECMAVLDKDMHEMQDYLIEDLCRICLFAYLFSCFYF